MHMHIIIVLLTLILIALVAPGVIRLVLLAMASVIDFLLLPIKLPLILLLAVFGGIKKLLSRPMQLVSKHWLNVWLGFVCFALALDLVLNLFHAAKQHFG